MKIRGKHFIVQNFKIMAIAYRDGYFSSHHLGWYKSWQLFNTLLVEKAEEAELNLVWVVTPNFHIWIHFREPKATTAL